MELAILNLCVNARDAHGRRRHDHDRRRERASRARTVARRSEFVSISVADPGCGMPPEVLARAFEPFFTTKDVEQGIGPGPAAGLRLRAAVWRPGRDRERGRRWHDRHAAAAAIACADPPIAAGRRRRKHAGAATDDGARRGHVLLVEDDREVAALTREMLNVARLRGHSRRERRRRARRAGQRARGRPRAVGHHDARRRERPPARARDPPAPSAPAGRR